MRRPDTKKTCTAIFDSFAQQARVANEHLEITSADGRVWFVERYEHEGEDKKGALEWHVFIRRPIRQ